MKAHVLIGFLLAAVATAHPVPEAPSNFSLVGTDIQFYSAAGIYVYDDDENLVRVDLTSGDSESEDQTQKEIESRVFFFLYTLKNPTEPQAIYVNDEEALAKSNFDPKKETRIVTHGWMNSRKSRACTLVRDAYIRHGDYNVIVVDWSKISFRPYIWASRRVKMVATFVASMINFLEDHGLDLSQTTMVGHSLGAHVMGLAARNAKGTVNYVVGLDPALPGFTFAGPGSRISHSDATHVEIIHTNAGLLGYLSAIGDSDFYPNGGSKQLGCLLDFGGACSHARSYQFFAESINSEVGFHGKRCKNYIQYIFGRCKDRPSSIMGEHKRIFSAQGIYYLKTNSKAPFARGDGQ